MRLAAGLGALLAVAAIWISTRFPLPSNAQVPFPPHCCGVHSDNQLIENSREQPVDGERMTQQRRSVLKRIIVTSGRTVFRREPNDGCFIRKETPASRLAVLDRPCCYRVRGNAAKRSWTGRI